MKKMELPELEAVKLDIEDVIATSECKDGELCSMYSHDCNPDGDLCDRYLCELEYIKS